MSEQWNRTLRMHRMSISPTQTPSGNPTIVERSREKAGSAERRPSFSQVLDAKMTSGISGRKEVLDGKGIIFSKHASDRLQQRNIVLTAKDLERIVGGMEKAGKKGVKEALLLLDDKVLLASIKNRTIITASTDDQLKDNVFTNIDGAVII